MENQNSRTGFSCICEKCGRTLYEGEMLNIKGRFICESCAESYVFGGSEPRRKGRVPSAFFHFIFSTMPGAGQMYLGLMKRGLFQMCLFFFCIYLTATTMPQFFGLTIPVVFFYSFFDSLALRRKIASGEPISDDLSGVSRFLSRNRGIIVLVVILMFVMGMFSSLFDVIALEKPHRASSLATGSTTETSVETFVSEAHASAATQVSHPVVRMSTYSDRHNKIYARSLVPILLIGLGGLIVVKSAKRKRGCEVDILDPADTRDHDIRN